MGMPPSKRQLTVESLDQESLRQLQILSAAHPSYTKDLPQQVDSINRAQVLPQQSPYTQNYRTSSPTRTCHSHRRRKRSLHRRTTSQNTMLFTPTLWDLHLNHLIPRPSKILPCRRRRSNSGGDHQCSNSRHNSRNNSSGWDYKCSNSRKNSSADCSDSSSSRTSLMKTWRTNGILMTLARIYCFNSLILSLQQLLSPT